MHKLTVILDRAHGSNVAGKRSPDGKHLEWKWSDERCNNLSDILEVSGFESVLTTKDDKEPGLGVRVQRMNMVPSPAFVLSLHNNAAGMGKMWMGARGVSIYTTKGCTKSDQCAEIIIRNIQKDLPEFNVRKDIVDGDMDYEENFTVLMSKHPSVLLEYGFQDNLHDVELLKNPEINARLEASLMKSLIEIEGYLCV